MFMLRFPVDKVLLSRDSVEPRFKKPIRVRQKMKKLLVGCLLFGLSAVGAGPTAAAAEESGAVSTNTIVLPTDADRELVREAERAMAAAQGTLGREQAFFLVSSNAWTLEYYRMLSGAISATATQLDTARSVVGRYVDLIKQGPGWPAPPPCRAPYTASPPVIDGQLDEPAWSNAAVFKGLYRFSTTNLLQQPATTWRLLCDRDYLYLGFECADTDIQAPDTRRDDKLFLHDCFEFFLRPDDASLRYWEVMISPAGVVFDGLQTKYPQGYAAVWDNVRNIEGLKVGCTVRGTLNDAAPDEGYTIEVAVPLAEIPGGTPPGSALRFMLVRFDQTGADPMVPYAHQPLLTWGHNIWNHGRLDLAEPAP